MGKQLFITQEVGSLQRPLWRQRMTRPLEPRQIDEAQRWGARLRVNEISELANEKGTGLLQGETQPTPEQKRRVIEIAAIMAVRLEERAGLDRVYNGEQPRTEMYDFLARHVDGITTAGTLNSFDSNYFKKGLLERRVMIGEQGVDVFAEELNFVLKHATRPAKPCLTGPYTMADWSYPDYYTGEAEARGVNRKHVRKVSRENAVLDFATRVLNPIVRRLAGSGAKVIQIDEPGATTDERESGVFVQAINESFRGVPTSIERAVHMCYSDYPVLFPYLADCVADTYLIEITNHSSPLHFRAEDIDPKAFRTLELIRDNTSASVGVGVVDNHSSIIEKPETVRNKVLYAAEVMGDPKRVQVNPDCGLRPLDWSVSYPKLVNLVEGTRLARTEFGE